MSISEYNTTQTNKEAHHSCCESLFGVLLTNTMQWDIMEANNSVVIKEESEALTYGFITFIEERMKYEQKT